MDSVTLEMLNRAPLKGCWRVLFDGSYVTLGNGVTLGDYVTLGNYVTLGDDVTLGNGVALGNYVTLGNGVTVEDHVTLDATPIYILGRRWWVGYCGTPGWIRSGCIHKPAQWWLDNVERCAEHHKYTPLEQQEYRMHIEHVAAWMRLYGVYEPANAG